MREKLADLLEKAIRYADENYNGKYQNGKYCGLMADYLLQNGVTVEGTLTMILREIAKTKALCYLANQMSLSILQNQYGVYVADKKEADKASKKVEESLNRTFKEIEKDFEYPKPHKKPDPSEWLLKKKEEK